MKKSCKWIVAALNEAKVLLVSSIVAAPLVMVICSAEAATIAAASVTASLGGNLVNQVYNANQVGGSTGAGVSSVLADTAFSTQSRVEVSSSGSPAVVHASVNADMSSSFNTYYSSNANSQSQGNISARFSDFITINALGMTGQTGYITGNFSVYNSSDTQITGVPSTNVGNDTYATIFSSVGLVLGSTAQSYSGQQHSSFAGIQTDIPLPASTYQLTTSFLFGTPFEVKANATFNWTAFARRMIIDPAKPHGPLNVADSEAIAIGTTDIFWNGISNLTDSNGKLVTFSLTSDSGFDYSNPVAVPIPTPEPSTILLFAGGLAGLAFWRRKKNA